MECYIRNDVFRLKSKESSYFMVQKRLVISDRMIARVTGMREIIERKASVSYAHFYKNDCARL